VRGTKRQGRHAPVHAKARPTERRWEADLDDDGADGGEPPGWYGPPDHASAATLGATEAVDTPEIDTPDVRWPDGATPPQPAAATKTGRALVREVSRRERALTVGGARLRLLVLACTPEDTTAVDIASGAVVRLRVPWPDGHEPDLSPFDVVEATLADDPERDDLAQPEAATTAALPRHVGTLRGWRARRMLARLAATPDGPLLGFPGQSAPYWEFRGLRPSVALVHPTRGPQLIRRPADGSTWVRFGWERDDVWLPVEDRRCARSLAAARRERLTGKPLAMALGYVPHYLLVTVSRPREGHCYQVCAAVLPRG
jgi:hypothetical protein